MRIDRLISRAARVFGERPIGLSGQATRPGERQEDTWLFVSRVFVDDLNAGLLSPHPSP